MALSAQHFTLEQFLTLQEQEPPLEYEDGMVTQKVSPKGKHSALQYALAERFNCFSQPTKLARAFPELCTTYAGRSYVPDISVYRWSRIPVDGAVRWPMTFWTLRT